MRVVQAPITDNGKRGENATGGPTMEEHMPNRHGHLVPSDIQVQRGVRKALRAAAKRKGKATFLTAYQLLAMLDAPLRQRLIQERRATGGQGARVEYAASLVMTHAARILRPIIIDYLDGHGLFVEIDGQSVRVSGAHCAVFRVPTAQELRRGLTTLLR